MRAYAIVTVVLALTSACQRPSASLPSEDKLRSHLSNSLEAGPGTIVSLDSIVAGDWRGVYVFGAYTSPEDINGCVGARVNSRSVGVQDGYYLIVLEPTRGNVISTDLRGGVRFGTSAISRYYPRGGASLIVAIDSVFNQCQLIPSSGLTRSCTGQRWPS